MKSLDPFESLFVDVTGHKSPFLHPTFGRMPLGSHCRRSGETASGHQGNLGLGEVGKLGLFEASESAKRIVAELTDDEIQQFVKSQESAPKKDVLTVTVHVEGDWANGF